MPRKGKAIVAINGKGEIVSGYDNVQEAARINHSHPNNIWLAIQKGTFHHKHKWMWEEDYRTLWFEGRTDELRHSFKEFRSRTVKKGRQSMSKDRKEQWKKNLSESKKRRNEPMPEHKSPLLCVTTGEVFPSQVHLARILGVAASAVSHAVRTGYKVKGMAVVKITKEEYEQRRNKKENTGNADRPPVD